MNTPGANPITNDPSLVQVTAAASSPTTVNGAGAPVSPVGVPGSSGAPASAGSPASAGQDQSLGVGTEGEVSVWKGRYSFKNFYVRIVVRMAVTVAWLVALSFLGDRYHFPGYRGWDVFVWGTGVAVGVFWLVLGWQILRARLGHRYELTNRRLFVDTGVFRRRRDQIELLRVQDVYVKQQGLFYRLLNVGTVVIESSEERLPVHYLTGVSDPNSLMDLIWHHARKERDLAQRQGR